MLNQDGQATRRQRIRDEAERILGEDEHPVHISLLARLLWDRLKLEGTPNLKTVGTSLHDDSQRRFLLYDRGTWTLKRHQR